MSSLAISGNVSVTQQGAAKSSAQQAMHVNSYSPIFHVYTLIEDITRPRTILDQAWTFVSYPPFVVAVWIPLSWSSRRDE